MSNWKQGSILSMVVFNHKNVHFCSSCRIQPEESLPFKGLSLQKVKRYTKAQIIDQKLFAVRIRNFADTINKRKKVRTSSPSVFF